MTTIEILKTLDVIAEKANSLWNQCESLKMRIAKQEHISPKKMSEHGIYIPDKMNAPNAQVNRPQKAAQETKMNDETAPSPSVRLNALLGDGD